MRIGFDELFDRLTAAGVAVGVDVDAHGHAIVLDDPGGGRHVRVPVRRGFDCTATTLVLSAQLAEEFPEPARLWLRDDVVYAGRWPEFGALWPVGV